MITGKIFVLIGFIGSVVYLPVPHSEKPEVLLQMAVKVLVEVVTTTLVMVDVPNASKNRLLLLLSGRAKPG